MGDVCGLRLLDCLSPRRPARARRFGAELQPPPSSWRGPGAALTRSDRGDSVTRDWPVEFKRARSTDRDASRLWATGRAVEDTREPARDVLPPRPAPHNPKAPPPRHGLKINPDAGCYSALTRTRHHTRRVPGVPGSGKRCLLYTVVTKYRALEWPRMALNVTSRSRSAPRRESSLTGADYRTRTARKPRTCLALGVVRLECGKPTTNNTEWMPQKL